MARTTHAPKLAAAALVLFVAAHHPDVLWSEEIVETTAAVEHRPLEHFVAGHRIQVEAKVTDPQGVSLVRCYFRAAGQADYVFVGMKAGESDTFTGILPAPAPETRSIEYLFLAVSGQNQVVKTQVFRTALKVVADVPDWQRGKGEGQLSVSSELAGAAVPKGFADSITFDVVESSARFGLVAGIHSTSQAAAAEGLAGAATGGASAGAAGGVATGATAGTAATAAGAGTAAASAGLSATVIVGAGAAAVAVAAGAGAVVAGDDSGKAGDTGGANAGGEAGGADSVGVTVSDAGGSSGSGDATSDGSSSAGPETACSRYAGNWTITSVGYDCRGEAMYDQSILTVGSDCSLSSCGDHGCFYGEVVGDTGSLSGTGPCGPMTSAARFTSTTTLSGTYQDSGGSRGTVSGTRQ